MPGHVLLRVHHLADWARSLLVMDFGKLLLCNICLKKLTFINKQSALSDGNWRRLAGDMFGKELGDHLLRVALATKLMVYSSNQGGVNGKVGVLDGELLPSLFVSGNNRVGDHSGRLSLYIPTELVLEDCNHRFQIN